MAAPQLQRAHCEGATGVHTEAVHAVALLFDRTFTHPNGTALGRIDGARWALCQRGE